MARKSRARRKSGLLQITSEEALDFIRQMQQKFRRMPRTKKEKAKLQEYLAQFTDQTLKAVGSRVQSDLMLRPPRTIPPRPTTRYRR